MKRVRPTWDFGYERAATTARDPESGTDVVVATECEADDSVLCGALLALGAEVEITTLFARAPLFWKRVTSRTTLAPEAIAAALVGAGVPIRYAAPARTPSMELAPPLDLTSAEPGRPEAWRARRPRPLDGTAQDRGSWFLKGGAGVQIDRAICGTGSRTRLAVIDDEAADLHRVELDDLVCVGVERAPVTSGHAGLMVGWAVGALREDGTRFAGVAPDASVRVYCIAKPGTDVLSLPVAIARAAFDGADVIVCATYMDGTTTSPMLDDALDVAVHLGRRGRGTLVVLPTGREASSAGNSVHASLSLGLSEPASDPRVHCIAPGGREGGWFLWRSPGGKLRPFANRGPAVRWLAPGDDVAYPFESREQLFHAESSGASAIAAGVALLVLGCNPDLRLPELHAIFARTVEAPEAPATGLPLADPADLLPYGHDRDGHNARTGYGRLNASAACAAAADALPLALTAIGEVEAAVRWCSGTARPYSRRMGRWLARALLARPDLEHAVRSLARHVRLIAAKPSRARSHAPGALARQLAMVFRELHRMDPPVLVAVELGRLSRALLDATRSPSPTLDLAAVAIFSDGNNDAAGANGPVSVADARS
jgi:hypothetical protein